jgi:hypothetical protein
MFAMLSGSWPRVTSGGIDVGALEAEAGAGGVPSGRRAVRLAAALETAVGTLVREAVAAQVEAGMGIVTDGQVRWADPAAALVAAIGAGDTGPDGMLVRAWRATAASIAGHGMAVAATVTAAQALPGPYSIGRLAHPVEAGPDERSEGTLALSARLAAEVAALADVGCRVVIVEEPGAVLVGADPGERDLFLASQVRLLADVAGRPGLHAMLSVTDGSAAGAGPATIFGAPYQSHLFDLIAGPDNWHLVRAAPADRGIVCGALQPGGPEAVGDQAPVLVWAAQYAASAGARGLDRIGLANAGSLGQVPPADARRALDELARAAGLAALPLAKAVEAGLDVRAVRTMPFGPMPSGPMARAGRDPGTPAPGRGRRGARKG